MAATMGNTARAPIWGGLGGLQCRSVSVVLYPSCSVQLVVVLHLTGVCNKKSYPELALFFFMGLFERLISYWSTSFSILFIKVKYEGN